MVKSQELPARHSLGLHAPLAASHETQRGTNYDASPGALMSSRRMFVRYMVHTSGAQMKNREAEQRRQQVG